MVRCGLHAEGSSTSLPGRVPEGELRLHVRPPASEEGCGGIFNVMGSTIVPSRDCQAAPGAPRVCDLGTLKQCFPFEMPPPRP
jgi:hypothetical protein